MTDAVHGFLLSPDGDVPNNPRLAVVVWRGAVPAETGPDAALGRMAANGWGGGWTWTVFDDHHYHPNAHETLIAVAGWAEIQLGGPSGPLHKVRPGDALILPAGTGHRRHRSSDDFAVCGAYPRGQETYETCWPAEMRLADLGRIAKTPLPAMDPIQGRDGPLMKIWEA